VPGISMGREDAPVVIYEFADFQCPGCGQFASFTAPLVKERLVDTGQVRFVYYDYPLISLHPNAFLAARAGRCANEQERFWDYHDVLYARQPTWSPMRDPTDTFVEMADELGLDSDAFESCLRSDRYQEEVSRSIQLAEMLGVRSTPTLFVNMKRIDLQSIPTYSDVEGFVRDAMGSAPAPDSAAPDTSAAAATP
jgi:protein-disulfide isomerase